MTDLTKKSLNFIGILLSMLIVSCYQGQDKIPTGLSEKCAENVSGCWRFDISFDQCSGEPQQICDMFCQSEYSHLSGNIEYQQNGENLVVLLYIFGEPTPAEGEGTVYGSTLSFWGTYRDPSMGIEVSVFFEGEIFGEGNQCKLSGPVDIDAVYLVFHCTAVGAFNAVKDSDSPCEVPQP